MHISEGILSPPLLLCGAALTVLGTAIGLKKLDYRSIPKAGILTACFFVASLIHIPFAAAKLHLTLAGLTGVILGWGAFPVILAGLILQSLFFQYGGITTLGVNALIMALPAALVSIPASRLIHKSSFFATAAVFSAGFISVLLSAALMGLFLLFSNEDFHILSIAAFVLHLPLMIAEGLITVFGVAFLKKAMPSILYLKTDRDAAKPKDSDRRTTEQLKEQP